METTRNATLSDLVELLKDQQGRRLDVVASAAAIRATDDGLIKVHGTEAVIDEDGVTPTDGTYRPTEMLHEGLSTKLGIPAGYLKRMHQVRPDVWAANVNGLLHGFRASSPASTPGRVDADPRSFLLRLFRGSDGGTGIARAFLSDRYGIYDNFDGLLAVLDGTRKAGVEINIDSCDLTDRRMYVKVVAPQLAAYAPKLLEGYRSPFDGRKVGDGWTPERVARASAEEGQQLTDPPVVFAGFVFSNSEVGTGSWSITPRLVVKVCNNGLTIAADSLRGVHLGGKMDEGLVRWSQDTERKSLELLSAKAADAVAAFLDVDYITAQVAKMEELAGTPVADAPKTIEKVTKALSFTEAQSASILDHFIKGGQLTAGGVMQAVTSAAQTVSDADLAAEMESAAFRVLQLAASLS